MRTKTLLLAVAALAAGVISSEAQNVYSQNIVGYVNVVTAATNQFALYANPLDNGTNTITSLFPSAGNGTIVETWNGAGFTIAQKSFGNWNTNLLLAPGTGFFIKYPVASGIVSNTFVGNVVVQSLGGTNNLGTNTVSLPTSFVLVGSTFPISGLLTDSGDSTLNLNGILINGSIVEAWNGSGFTIAQKSFGNWNTNLSISVGQGVFIKSKNATNWVEQM